MRKIITVLALLTSPLTYSHSTCVPTQNQGQVKNITGYIMYGGSLHEVSLTLTYESYGWVVTYYRLGESFRNSNGSCQATVKALNPRHQLAVNYNLKNYAELQVGTVYF